MRFTNPVPQFWLDNGELASSGKMYFYENNDYSTAKNTYSRSDNTNANTNPVILDGQGRMPPCFGQGLYSVKFYSADGSLQWTRDDVSLSSESGQMELWVPAIRYAINDIAKDPSDGDYYQLYGAATSIGNQPSTSLNLWQKIVFITEHNTNKTYEINEIVTRTGFIYRSLENNNSDTPPSAKWGNLTFNNSVAGDLSVGGNLTVTGSATGTTPPAGDSDTSFATTAFVQNELTRQTQSVTLPSPFTSGSVKFSKVGNVVVASVIGLSHLSAAGVSLASGFIPVGYRPSSNQKFSNFTDIGGLNARVSELTFEADGGFGISYWVIGGGTASTTGTYDSSFSWVI